MDADLRSCNLIEMYAKNQKGYDVVVWRADTGDTPIRSSLLRLFIGWYKRGFLFCRNGRQGVISAWWSSECVDAIRLKLRVNRFQKELFLGSALMWPTSLTWKCVGACSRRNLIVFSGAYWAIRLDGFINFSRVPLKLATWAGTLYS